MIYDALPDMKRKYNIGDSVVIARVIDTSPSTDLVEKWKKKIGKSYTVLGVEEDGRYELNTGDGETMWLEDELSSKNEIVNGILKDL